MIPVQLPIFLLVIAWRTRFCSTAPSSAAPSTPSASAPRARATPASRCEAHLRLVYLLAGLVSSLAAIIYVAHLGQAKSDAGTGYELDAITAVVLGGTSVFGGRGTSGGTLLGLFFLSVLQNGLHLAALPSELTGVLTGVLLVLIISFDRLRIARVRPAVQRPSTRRRA